MNPRTYGDLAWVESNTRDFWCIPALEPHVCIRLKSLFPRIPKGTTVPFTLPDTPDTAADLHWFMQRYPLRMSESVRHRLAARRESFYQAQEQVEDILRHNFTPRDYALKPGQVLRPYQAQAVEVLRAKGALLLADEVGLGKTYVGLAACTHQDALPALVVCQTHLPAQWAKKAQEFTFLRTHILQGTRPYTLPPAEVYITAYTRLYGWVDHLAGRIKTVIFDEAQELRKGVDTRKGASAWSLASQAAYALALTATPIYNYGDEIFHVLDLIKAGCLGDKGSFLREWAPDGNPQKPTIKDPAAFGTYLRESHLLLRRGRPDVGQQMPPVTVATEMVPHDDAAAQSVAQLAEVLAMRVLNGSFHEQGQAARELDLLLRQATGVAKAKHVAAFVRVLLESGEPVLLAGWHREVYNQWLRLLADHRPLLYTGSETPAVKDLNAQAFMAGESNLLIISLRSGIGLDGLQQRCSVVVFGELDWSPQVHHQVIGRLDREGQTKPVLALYLHADFGSDPLMLDLLGLKASQAQAIIDPLAGPQLVHTDEGRIKALARSWLERSGRKMREAA